MAVASGSVRAFTDADLPYGPEPILLALGYIENRRAHAVIGDRTLPGSTYDHAGPVRSAVSGVASFAFRTLVTGGIYDTQCGFKAFRGDVAEELFRLTTINRFAIDVELIYLLLKYRLDPKRIPVQLRDNSSSTVRVLRDAARASADIARMRRNWATGRYRSEVLKNILRDDIQADLLEFRSPLRT
jgi:dolichyl-phosphate beta-glucosyltransferase